MAAERMTDAEIEELRQVLHTHERDEAFQAGLGYYQQEGEGFVDFAEADVGEGGGWGGGGGGRESGGHGGGDVGHVADGGRDKEGRRSGRRVGLGVGIVELKEGRLGGRDGLGR